MDFKKLANQAKAKFEESGGEQKLKDLQTKAKAEYDKRGGAEGLKESAKHVADAAKGKGSVADKARAAAEAARAEVKK